jgi:MtrB/PioB family decaheme-associated outer membrane protein
VSEDIMRNRLIMFIGAVVVALPATTLAQATLPAPSGARDQAATAFSGRLFGDVDFGGRFTTIDGDEARYQRYRDLRDGPFARNLSFNRRTADWTVAASATNIGYRDQRYQAELTNVGKLRVSLLWDQVPLFISRDTRTLYAQVQPGVFRLEDAMQANNQAGLTTIRNYVDQAVRFDTRTRRDIGAFDVVLTASPALDLAANVTTTTREGAIPYGAPFGFSNLVELPVPIDQRTTDAKTSIEWASQRGMVSVGWDGSWFDNRIETLIWDNPLKIADSPSYSSAYIDGRGPAQARMALWPSNTQQFVHATGSVVTPGRGRLLAYVAIGENRQNADLLPHTINALIPDIPLERPTAEAEVRNTLFNVQYTARPIRQFAVSAKYRYADLDNRTPHFETFGRVRFDGAYDDAANSPEPEAYSVRRQTFDVDGTLSAVRFASLKVGYTNQVVDRTFRIFRETTENTFRLSVDSIGNPYFTVRALFEDGSREGDSFDEHLLEHFAEQPGMRHYDVSNRERRRGTLMVTAHPTAVFGFSASAGLGRDEYPEAEFGLQSYDTNQYAVGVDVIPNDRVGFNVVYAWEDYASLTRSRTAAPAPDPQFFDPRRNWFMDYDGKVTNVDATLDLAGVAPRTNLRFNVNWADATDRYTFVRTADTVLPAPSQLDPVVNEILRGAVDLDHRLSTQIRVGASYWYENYKTQDFALGPTTISDIALPAIQPGAPPVATNSLLMGYLYRPYTAHTAMLRLTYLW